jgi:GGDEF domain-containing protein
MNAGDGVRGDGVPTSSLVGRVRVCIGRHMRASRIRPNSAARLGTPFVGTSVPRDVPLQNRSENPVGKVPPPQTFHELQMWMREHLGLTPELEASLSEAVEAVFSRHERLWQESKQDAIQALSTGFAEKMARVQRELSAKDATVSSIAHYFEQLVADLTDKSHRDPKTKLINLGHFTHQLESFLSLEQRGRWCAVGLVDIANFKRYNDTLGHQVGDRIIERVAQLLREQVRSVDLIAQESLGKDSVLNGVGRDLHARFGGDEFCFLIPDLAEGRQAYAVGERFRAAVAGYDWSLEDVRLAANPPRVDVGVVCLWLGRMADRRFVARHLAGALIQRADQLMYQAKNERASRIQMVTARIVDGKLSETSGPELG